MVATSLDLTHLPAIFVAGAKRRSGNQIEIDFVPAETRPEASFYRCAKVGTESVTFGRMVRFFYSGTGNITVTHLDFMVYSFFFLRSFFFFFTEFIFFFLALFFIGYVYHVATAGSLGGQLKRDNQSYPSQCNIHHLRERSLDHLRGLLAVGSQVSRAVTCQSPHRT